MSCKVKKSLKIKSSKTCKKEDSNVLNIILIQDFCLLKTEIAWFPFGFRFSFITEISSTKLEIVA